MQDDPTLKRFQAGENSDGLCDAIESLYVEWRMDLWRLAAFNTVGLNDDLEDLIQEVFLQLYRQVSNGVIIQNPKCWLYKAIIHRATDLRRKRQRTTKYLKTLPTAEPHYEQGVHESLECVELLKQALLHLNVREQEILMLRYLQLTHQEIAEILDTTVSLVSVYTYRAFHKLRMQIPKAENHD